MYYINAAPNENGSHGNPGSNQTALTVRLPDELLSVYLDTMGFANIIVEDGKVTSVLVNQTALDAYKGAHPDTPSPSPEPSAFDRLEAQAIYTAMMTDTLLED